jgi:hypothetical protein
VTEQRKREEESMKSRFVISAISAILGALLTLVVSLAFKNQPVDPSAATAQINAGQAQIAAVLSGHENAEEPLSVEEVRTILEGSKMVAEGSLELGMMSENPNFDACMTTTGVICGLDGGIATLTGAGPWDFPEATGEELYKMDWTVKGCEFDATTATGTDCESIKPEKWPPVDPAGWATQAKQGADMGFSIAEMALASFLPTEGDACVRGAYVKGTVEASHDQTDNVFDDAVQGKFSMQIVDATFKLSGCTFPSVPE